MLSLRDLTVESKEEKSRPFKNSTYIPGPGMAEPRSMNLDQLIYWVKHTPECIGIVRRIATDIVTNFHFESIVEQTTGRPSPKFQQKIEERAIAFCRRNHFKEKLLAAVIDWLITGDAYIWKGRVSENQIKEITKKHIEAYGIDVETKEISYKQFFDEDWNMVNAIEVIPSSMVEIKHDSTKIDYYLQRSKATPEQDKKFYPDQVIHAKFMEIDGKVYGYSPMEASYIAIKTINAIQDYNYNYFANGVKLDRAWLFMGNPSQNYLDQFEENIGKYKSVRYARGDLIAAGADKIDMKELNKVSEEMEHRQLAIHAVGRLAFAYNMPADILSSILGVDVRGTAMGSDIEDAGYNRNIERSQEYWSELLDTELFAENLKVNILFESSFKQDQVKQVQYQVQAATVADYMFKHKFPVTDEYFMELMQVPRKYREEGKIKREVEEMPKPPLAKPSPGPKQQAYSDAKKAQQRPQMERKESKESTATYLNNSAFISEVQKWAGNQEILYPRAMQDGDNVLVKFSIPNTGEEIRTVFDKSDWPNENLKARAAMFKERKIEQKEVTYLNPENFLKETQRWGVSQDSIIRVRMMEKGSKVYFKFAIPHTSEEVRTMIPGEEYTTFDWMNLNQIVVPAIWDEKFDFKPQKKDEVKKSEGEQMKILIQKFEAKPVDDAVKATFGMAGWEGF